MHRYAILISFLLIILFMVATPASAGWSKVVYEADSLYHHIRVVDETGKRLLRFDNSVESMMNIANPYTGHFEYIDFFFQSFVLNPDIEKAAMLGLGGASAPKLMMRHFGEVEVDIVEIDEMVFDVAQEYFSFEPTENVDVTIQDARVFLRKSDEVYDLVVMDAYTANKYGSYIPFHLATQEFFQIVDAHLSDDGVFAINIIGQLQGERDEIVASIYRTMSTVFPSIYIFPALTTRNVVMLASKDTEFMSRTDWSAEASRLVSQGYTGFYPNFQMRANQYYTSEPPNWEKAQLLTDDFAPLDGLLQ
jgi:spermidine synthase